MDIGMNQKYVSVIIYSLWSETAIFMMSNVILRRSYNNRNLPAQLRLRFQILKSMKCLFARYISREHDVVIWPLLHHFI